MRRCDRPIIIFGSHRSGTTFAGTVLGSAPKARLVRVEPFNIGSGMYSLAGLAEHWFTYPYDIDERAAWRAFDTVLRLADRRLFIRKELRHWIPLPTTHTRLVIKDPIASFAAEWIYLNFSVQPVVLVRHPAAFAASLKRLHWTHPFSDFTAQPALMRDLLDEYRAEIEDPPTEVVHQAALLWRLIYSTLAGFLDRYPEWLMVRHEDLSRQPIVRFQHLFGRLGLPWSRHVERQIRSLTSASTAFAHPSKVHDLKRASAAVPLSWKVALTTTEIDWVRRETSDVWPRFYSESDW